MARGIERRSIFRDDEDRERFLSLLVRVLADSGTRCFAFAAMPNHYHLLLGTGATPLSRVMARLGTAYALAFNRRHRRVGHLFQNRYKSRLVEGDSGLLTLVRYIHLNPVKARIVPDLEALASYPWTGHAALMGRRRVPFLDTDAVLGSFEGDPRLARRQLLRWMMKAPDDAGVPPYDESVDADRTAKPANPGEPFDDDPTRRDLRRRRLREAGWGPARVRSAVCAHLRLDPALLGSGHRTRPASRAREGIAGLVVEGLGRPHVEAAAVSGISRQCAEKAPARFAAWPTPLRDNLLRLLPPLDD
jgi:REP element-mobilizing transposase RayT